MTDESLNLIGAALHSIRKLARVAIAQAGDADLGALAHAILALADLAAGELETLGTDMHFERSGPNGGVLCQSAPVAPSVNRTTLQDQVTCPECLRILAGHA